MRRRSLTAKILVAVGITVAGVIAIYTYFVIRVQSTWWLERIQAQNVNSATLVHEYLRGVMLSDRHLEVQGFLVRMKESGEIERGRIIKPDGTVIFSTETQEVQRVTMTVPAELFQEDRVLQGERRDPSGRVAVAMRPVASGVNCRRCHLPDTLVLGAIVLEKSLAPAEANIAANRNLLILYGVVIFVLVGVVLWLLIVRLVTDPVGNLLQRMQQVRAGDLRARAPVETRDEIGELATNFNSMVQSLDTATRELRESHEKQLQQADKLATLGELASSIAHEIRNPLAGIGAAVQVLAETGRDGPEREIVVEIHRQVQRLNNTLRELLDFARQREPELLACEVQELVRPMLALLRPDAQKNHVELVEDYAADLPLLWADPQQVQQALLNLLLNAVQAMPQGGRVLVAAEPLAKSLLPDHPQSVRLTVQDNGPGIAPEHLGKIFSPFFTTKHRGTGLGLTITRSIVEKHHGTITVCSEPGHGTMFVLEFAAAPAAAPGILAQEERSHATP